MTLGALIVLLIICGVVMALVPMDATIRKVLLVIIIVAAIIVVARMLGVF